jgi:hypothetical protein
LLLQQQAQRAQSVSIGAMQRQQQEQQQPAHANRMPGSHATVSRTGSAVSAAGSSSGRAIAAAMQHYDRHDGGYSSSNASRSSSPAELSSSLDLRRRSLVAASAASLEGRRPGSPLGQSLSAAGSAGLGSAVGVMGAGGSMPGSPREMSSHAAAAAAAATAAAAAAGVTAGGARDNARLPCPEIRTAAAAIAAATTTVEEGSASVGEVAHLNP